jgi:hypothetical protein
LSREVGRALAPLGQRLATDNVLTLFAELGMQFPPELLNQSAFTNALNEGVTAAAAIPPLVGQLSTAIEQDRAEDIVRLSGEIINQIRRVIAALDIIAQQLRSVSDSLPNMTPEQVNEFAQNLPARLLDFLVVTYLESRQPLLTNVLALTGIIERTRNPGIPDDPTRPPFIARTLRLARLGQLIQSPLDVLRTIYGWGDPGFDGQLLLARFQQFLDDLGIPSDLQPPALGAPTALESFLFELRPNPTTSPPGLVLALHVPVEGGFDLNLPEISPGWALRVLTNGRFAAGTEATIVPPTTVSLAPPTGTLDGQYRGELVRRPISPATAVVLLGQTGASRLEAASLTFTLGFNASWDAAAGQAGGEALVQVGIADGKVVIDTSRGDGILMVLTAGLRVEAAFDLRASWQPSTGARFEGSSALEISRPVELTVGPMAVQRIYLRASPLPAGGIPIELSGSLRIALGPLEITLDRIGAEGLLSFPERGNLGPADFAIAFKPPNGAGLSMEAGPVSGGGFLRRDAGPPERYAGALAVRLTRFSVNAFGVFERTPSGRIALVTVLGIRFLPAFQLGFGFALTGVGGLVGINRRADIDALRERLVSGAAGNVLFAEDPIRNAPTLLGDLRALFPTADGIFVVGPTVQIGWFALARFDLGIIVELPGPSKIVVLGSARLQIGGEGGIPALVQIRLDIVGVIDFVKKLTAFDAMLVNSRLLQIFHLTGTAAFRLSTGDRPYVLLTIGGFHPAFNPGPIALPPQNRVALTYDTGGSVRLSVRLEAYLAVTSNTFQTGAALEVEVVAGPLNALGFLGFNALIQFDPFYFAIDFAAGFRVRFWSLTLAGVSFAGSLSGPGPLVLSGTFCIEILFFRICWSGSFALGQESGDGLQPIPSLVDALAPELDRRENLEATGGEDREVAVAPGRVAPPNALVAPQGQLIWRQKRAPLNVPVERLEGVPLSRPQAVVAESQATRGATQDWFSPGTFINLSESEALNRPPFERLDAGVQLGGFEFSTSGSVTHRVEVETIRVPEQIRRNVETLLFPAVLLDAILERLGPGRVLFALPIIGMRYPWEPWTLLGWDGAVLASGLSQTDAHQRARAQGATALPALDARETINLGGI